MSLASKLFLAFAVLLIALSTWAAVQPSHMNWGIHSGAFYSTGVQILAFIFALLLLVPTVQKKLLSLSESIAKRTSGISPLVWFGVVAVACVGLWLTFPSKLHLLGDGAILLRSVAGFEGQPGIPENFRNQPLVYIVFRACEKLVRLFMVTTTRDVYYAIDLLSGVLFVALLFWVMEKIDRPRAEKILLGILVLAGGGFQFFFGYIENYVLQYIVTAAFVFTGWFALENETPKQKLSVGKKGAPQKKASAAAGDVPAKTADTVTPQSRKKVHIIVPVALFVLMVGFNLGCLILTPALLYLLAARFGIIAKPAGAAPEDMKRGAIGALNWLRISLIGVLAAAAGAALLYAIGFNIIAFATHFLTGSPDFLPVLPTTSNYYPYSMFSPFHVLDWLNALLHIAPFGLIMAAVPLIMFRKERIWKSPAAGFVIVAAFFGMLFPWIVNTALGSARDWDLLAGFFVPLMVLGVYCFQLPFAFPERTAMLVSAAFLTVLHLSLGLGINASEEKHEARAEMLNDHRVLSVGARLWYDDALGNYFYDTGRYDKSRRYYEDYVHIGSGNTRLIANLSDCYRRLSMKDEYFATLKMAVEMNSKNPGVYSNLGVEYASRGDTTNAEAMNLRCIALDSTQAQAYANLAVLYLNGNKPALALGAANDAMRFGFREPVMYRVMAKADIRLHRLDDALKNYDLYLAVNPADQTIRNQRDRIAAEIRK